MNPSTTVPGESARAPGDDLHAYALAAHAAGLCVVPPKQDGSKMPVSKPYENEDGEERHGWTPWQSERSTPDELRDWYEHKKRTGIGYVCGAVSGGLEMLEFEQRETRDAFVSLAEQLGLGDLVARIESGYCSETPGGGVHWLYRCDEVAGNERLASRPKRPEEKKHPKDDVQVLIETRGEGGYTVEAPSNGKVHPTGGAYRLISGGVETIARIAPDERRQLFDLAETFDDMPENAPTATPEPAVEPTKDDGGDITFGPARDAQRVDVIKDFNARATWEEILGPHSWVRIDRGGAIGFWRRPGKDRYWSATTNYGGSDKLCVFSSSTEFKVTEKKGSKAGYDKFGAYAVLNHNGDQKAAYRDLSDKGYGREWTPPADWTEGLSDEEIKRRAKERREHAAGTPTANGTAHQGAGTPADAEPKLKRTEWGISEMLVHEHGKDLRFCHPWGAWLTWDGRRYRLDQTGEARRRAKATIRKVYAIAAETEDDKKRQKLLTWARQLEKAATVSAMLKNAESEPGIPILPEDMDADPFLFNVLNGTITLRTGECRPHDRADHITKLAPVTFDAEATCPTFDAYLERVVPDEDVRRFLQRAVGYSLTADTSEQCLFFLYGGGANGKSTLLTLLGQLLGDYAKHAAPELLTHKAGDRHPTELADLFGARLVTSVEVDEGKRLAENLVKQMTGGDPIKARRMRQDFFEWLPTHKLFLAANHKPTIRGTDYAIWRRIHLIPFDVTIPKAERDKGLAAKLRAELPGILNWAIAGCMEWQRDGLGVPEAVEEATEAYRTEQDVVGEFIAEQCIVAAEAWAVAGALYKAYAEWAEAAGERPMSAKLFGARLSERGYTPDRRRIAGKLARVWLGLGLLGPSEGPERDASGGCDASGHEKSDDSSNPPHEAETRESASQRVTPPDASRGDGGNPADEQGALFCKGCGATTDGETHCSSCVEPLAEVPAWANA